MKPTLSIVVIGRNEGDRLVRCLQSVRAAQAQNDQAEIIYVDSHSADDSAARAQALGATVIELQGKCSAARARNAGWQIAAGDWVLFLDGDTVLDPAFLTSALGHTSDAAIAAVWGHRRELSPTANVYHRVLDLDWVYAPGESEFCGGDTLMRRAALEQVGGFDASLIAGEEPELCSRLRAARYVILHIDAPMTGHDLAIARFSQYWKHAVRAGYAYAQLAARTRRSQVPMWRAEARRNVVRALLLFAIFFLLPLSAVWHRSWIELAGSLGFAAAIIARSAFRARWKGASPLTLLCYGVHSHLQQIPIFAGQIACRLDATRARSRGLIEYK